MLALAFYTLAFTLAQQVQVRIAPDQPAPLFFTDEPLVVQVRADVKTTASPEIEAELPDGRRVKWAPGPLKLAPGRAKWLTMEGLPVLRGPHMFHVRISPDTPVEERTLVRIDRPIASTAHVAVVAMAWPSPAARYAAQCVGAGVQFPLAWPTLDDEVAAFIQPGHTPIHVRITASNGRHPRTIDSAVTALGDRVDLWSVGGAISPREEVREAIAIHDVRPHAKWGVYIPGAAGAAGLFPRTIGHPPNAIVCTPNAAQSIDDTSARAGFERMPLLVEIPPDVTASPAELLHILVERVLVSGRDALIPQEVIETPSGFSGALAVVSALRTHLAGAKNLGRLTNSGANEAWVFRLAPAASPDTWAIMMFIRDPSTATTAIAPGDGAAWNVLDAFGNPLGDAGRPDGLVMLPSSGAGAWYVRGGGGTLLREAAARRVRALAAAQVENSGELGAVASEAVGSLEALTNYELPGPVRLHFFALLRSLPALEEGWRRGIIETHYAIPLIRDCAALAETLAMLEQELEEPFLEPLDRTLANCADWLARFTESEDENPLSVQRLEFLRSEVTRLVDEARALDAAGRPIEAKAIAALAEWRARSLEPAATIDWPELESLSVPEEAVPQEEQVPPEAEEDKE